MPYPPRPQLAPLPQFAGTARNGTIPSRDLQNQLEAYVVTAYLHGRSLREIAELVDRTQTAVRRVLNKHQVPRRPVGARRSPTSSGRSSVGAGQQLRAKKNPAPEGPGGMCPIMSRKVQESPSRPKEFQVSPA